MPCYVTKHSILNDAYWNFSAIQTDSLLQHYLPISVPICQPSVPYLKSLSFLCNFIGVYFWLQEWIPSDLQCVSLHCELFKGQFYLSLFSLGSFIIPDTEYVFSKIFLIEFPSQDISALNSVILDSSCIFPSKIFQPSFVKRISKNIRLYAESIARVPLLWNELWGPAVCDKFLLDH